MRKMIAIAGILFLVAPVAKANEAMTCLKNVEISIKHVTPNFMHIVDNVKRKDKILLRMNVDCVSGKILVPSSLADAKDWLDLALPYDFKTGLTKGSYFDAYLDTTYGDSVEYDLYHYFNVAWKLEPDSAVCKAVPSKPYEKKGLNWCFYNLIDAIREDYKNSKALSPGSQ